MDPFFEDDAVDSVEGDADASVVDPRSNRRPLDFLLTPAVAVKIEDDVDANLAEDCPTLDPPARVVFGVAIGVSPFLFLLDRSLVLELEVAVLTFFAPARALVVGSKMSSESSSNVPSSPSSSSAVSVAEIISSGSLM